jgi:PhzF family phenazine biosynthesis protein
MRLPIFQVDAFTDRLFSGNPAAVIPLSDSLSEELMQSIALENNLSETAFIDLSTQPYNIRWFTPTIEVDLCGHATLASAKVLFDKILDEPTNEINFQSKSGALRILSNRTFADANVAWPHKSTSMVGVNQRIL